MLAVVVALLAAGVLVDRQVTASSTPRSVAGAGAHRPAVAKAGTTPGATPAWAASSAPAPARPPLAAVACATASTCIAVGGPGQAFVSRDGAATWTPASLPTGHELFGVACPTATRCVAVGDAGTILVSDDGVAGWAAVASGTAEPLSSVACEGESCAAVGDAGSVVASSDAGSHWGPVDRGTAVVNGVACGAANECVAVTSSAADVLRTTNGAAWSPAAVDGGPLISLLSMNGVSCSSSTCVMVGARGTIGYSDDGGASWSFDGRQVTDQTLNAVSCSSASVCVAVGESGTVLATADGGVEWTVLASPTAETLLGVDCVATGTCMAVGDGGTILAAAGASGPWAVRAGAPVPGGTPLRVLVVGDSFAHTVALTVGRDAAPYGVTLVDGAIDGCSLARGDTVSLPVGGPCAATGPGWAAPYAADLDQYQPALSLLVLGPWDLSARFVDGQWLSPGQPAYDSYYAGQLAAAVQILSSRGGRVAVATVPFVATTGPEPCAPPPATEPNCPTEAQRVAALDAVAGQVVAGYGGRVALIALGQHLAPSGGFTSTVDGVVVRAADGVHLSEPGGEWLTPWLVPQLVAAPTVPPTG